MAMTDGKRFKLVDPATEYDVLGGTVDEGNVYVRTYGRTLAGYKPAGELAVGESALREYALSGQKPTTYKLVRVQ